MRMSIRSREYCKQIKNGEYPGRVHTIIRLFLDDTGVSQQIPHIPGPSLHMFPRHIFEIFQDLTVAEIKW